MHDEVAELLSVLKNITTTDLGKRTYYQGTLNNTEVVVVFSRWGKVAASVTTTQLINTFSPSEIIFTGVAGGINPDLNIGDIVIGKELVQHDMDASPLFPKFDIPLLDIQRFNTLNSSKFEASVVNFINNYQQHVSASDASTFKIQTPKTIQGLIASGDQFISSPKKVADLQTELPELQCVEMEGAAVAQVCYEYEVPFQIIRIISDKANDDAPIDFPVFTKQVASKYAKGILENYID